MTIPLVLALLNVLMLLVGAFLSSRSSKGYEINHIVTFSLGFLIYWLVPILVGETGLFAGEPVMERLWVPLYRQIPRSRIVAYLLTIGGSYWAFVGGSWLCGWLYRGHRVPDRRIYFDGRLLSLYMVFGLVAALGFGVTLTDQFFHGYTAGIYSDVGWRGSFTAVSVFLLVVALVFTARREEDRQGASGFWRALFNPAFILYFIVALLVLSMGGRLYFVSSLLMLLVYRTTRFERIRIGQILLILSLGLVAMGVVGVLRVEGRLNAQSLAFNLLSEPLFTGFSLIDFLRDGPMKAFSLPVSLLGNLLNLVPSIVWPGKVAVLARLGVAGASVYAPFGALNAFLSFMINFGILGTIVFMFVLSFLLRWLRLHSGSIYYQIPYVMISGWLAFTFFRDPFWVSLVKAMLQFSVLTPTLIIVSLHVMSAPLRSRQRSTHVPKV